jgi:hypothetical protein
MRMSTRRPNQFLHEPFVLAYDHAQVTADTTIKLFKAARKMRIKRVSYINPTGLAAHGSDYFSIKVMNGTNAAARWSTETGEEGTLTGDTFVEVPLSSTDADTVVAKDAVIALFLDETGAATLPVGRIVIEGVYL